MKYKRNNRVRLCALAAVLIILGTAVFGMLPGDFGSAFAAAGNTAAIASGNSSTAMTSGNSYTTALRSSVADPVLEGGPQIGAKYAVVMEVGSGAVLYSKNATESCSPMSLTKLLTALLALEKLSVTDTLSFSYQAIHGIGSNVTRVGIVENERITVQDGLYAMLVASADEVAYALGEKMGGGKIKNFYEMMNERVQALGGVNSDFSSATGTGGAKQTSCAYDLGLVACALSQYPLFNKIASSSWYEIPVTNLKESRMLAQTHAFIRKTKKYEYATAGKSGGQAEDKTYSLCTYAAREGMTVVAIVLGSPNSDSSYDDTVSIINYAFENYKAHAMKEIENAVNEDYSGLFDYCPMFDDGSGDLVYIDRNSTIVLPRGADPSTLTKTVEYNLPDEYVHGENVIGRVVYLYQGHRVGNAGILYNNPEFPMSQEEFDAVWPYFLIPPSMLPSLGGSGVVIDTSYLIPSVTPTPEVTPTPAEEDTPATVTSAPKPTSTPLPAPGTKTQAEDATGFLAGWSIRAKARLLGGAIFAGLFLPCVIIIFIVLPRRHRRKNRVTKRL